MGLFHVKKGTCEPLPDKDKLTAQICMDFCSHERKCSKPSQLCMHGKHHTQWKYIPGKDKAVFLKHMDKTGLMWLDEETFKKHKVTIALEYAHLLGNANGPKTKEVATTTAAKKSM